jgi:hypothetical protein
LKKLHRKPGMMRMGSERSSSTNRGGFRVPNIFSAKLLYVVCVKSGDYVDLEPMKVYRVRHDASAKEHGMLRVIDASGEDYLYPADFFRPIQAPRNLSKIVAGNVG